MEVASVSRGKLGSVLHPGRIAAAILIALIQCAMAAAQTAPNRQQSSANSNQANANQERISSPEPQTEADTEFQTGTTLTKKGLFREAIPHLLRARSLSAHEYAANFNLAL